MAGAMSALEIAHYTENLRILLANPEEQKISPRLQLL